MFGIDPQAPIQNLDLSNTSQDDDGAFKQTFNQALNTPADFYWVGKNLMHGQLLWSETMARHIVLENGDVVWDGIIADITEKVNANEREREQRTLAEALRNTAEALNSSLNLDDVLHKILDKLQDVIPFDAMHVSWVKDGQLRILRARGYTPEQKKTMLEQFAWSEYVTFTQVIESRQPLVIPDVRSSPIWKPTPTTQWVRSHVKAPIVVDGEVVGTINLHSKTPNFYTDTHAENLKIFANQVAIAARNARIFQEVEYAAAHDALTGLSNRRKFMLDAEKELKRAARHQFSISLIIMDIDHFKKINDTFGHPAGDSVLIHLGQILTKEIRAYDLVGRYGGEEFILFMPETSLKTAALIAERIRKNIASTPIMVDGHSISLTISMGLVSNDAAKEQDFEFMLKQADALLYQAKQAGRNRIVNKSV